MRTNDITPEFEKVANEAYNTMEDNTQVDDKDKELSFVKMSLTREHVDFVAAHYGFENMVELNTVAIYFLKMLAHMKNDGHQFATFRTKEVEGKQLIDGDTYRLDFESLVKDLITRMKDNKPIEPL